MDSGACYTVSAIDGRMKNMNPAGTSISVPSGSQYKYFEIKHDDDEVSLYSFSFTTAGNDNVGVHVTFVLPSVYHSYSANEYDELWNNGTYSVRIAKGSTDANNVTDYRLYVWDIANATEIVILTPANAKIVKFTPTQTLVN